MMHKARHAAVAVSAAVVVVAACDAHAGRIAIHQRDLTNLESDTAQLRDFSGSFVADLATAGADFPRGFYTLQSLDFDATTSHLHGLTRVLNSEVRLLTWHRGTGALLSDIELAGYPDPGVNNGIDVAVHDGIVAVHSRDTSTLTSDLPRLYNLGGGLIASLSTVGTASHPAGYHLQSLDFDATTSRLHGLARVSGPTRVRLLTWDTSGTLLSDVPLVGHSDPGTNGGVDVSVHNGIVAVHTRDSSSMLFDEARLYDLGGSLITNLSMAGSVFDSSSYFLQSLDFHDFSGNLYAAARGPSGSTRVLSWDPSGNLLSDIELTGFPTIGLNEGLDLAVIPEPSAVLLALMGLLASVGRPPRIRTSRCARNDETQRKRQ